MQMKHGYSKNPDTAASSAESKGIRVRYVRDKLLRLSREEFCKQSAISHQSLKAWELGWGGGLTENGARKFSKHAKDLGIYCSVPWVMYGIGSPPAPINLKHITLETEEEHIARELLLFRENINAIDTVMYDDGMEPMIKKGDYIGGIAINNPKKAIGQACIVKDITGQEYIRVLQQGDQFDFFHLICLNIQTDSAKEIRNIKLEYAAPIVWLRRTLINIQ